MEGTKKAKELYILSFWFCFFLLDSDHHKPYGSKNIYMAQNLASGDSVTGKATIQLVRMDCLL